MKKNEASQALFLQVKQDYNTHSKFFYDPIWYCLSQQKRKKHEISLPFIISGKMGSIGCKYMTSEHINNCKVKIFYELIELIRTDYFIHVKVHVYKTIPETFDYDYVIDLFYCGANKTNIFSTFIYDNDIHITDSEIHYELLRRKNAFINNEHFIKNMDHLKFSKNIININVSLNILWDILLNMKTVNKYSKFFRNEIKYENNLINKGLELELINKNLICKGKVIECYKRKGRAVIEISVEAKNNSLSAIKIFVNEFDRQCNILLFYYFEKEQNYNKIQINEKKNENELIKFKNIVEHFKNHNYKSLLENINKITNKVKELSVNK